MKEKIHSDFRYTLYACYAGYVVQAAVNNYICLLYSMFASSFRISLGKIAFLSSLNFLIQLTADIVSIKAVDKIGYRRAACLAHILAAAGYVLLSFLPDLFGYGGIIVSMLFCSAGGGLIEVVISPITEACPTEKKEAEMAFLHSFYCWGQAGVVLISTAVFFLRGISSWCVLSLVWAALAAAVAVLFTVVPVNTPVKEEEAMKPSELFRSRLFCLLAVMMICAGASELAMSQWSSYFAEITLGISKSAGDTAGPCLFAVLMGTSRVIFAGLSGRHDQGHLIRICAVLCFSGYLLAAFAGSPAAGLAGCALCGFSVGIFWPGTFSAAARVLPAGGTAMYALLALAGDIGCSAGPGLAGFISALCGGQLGAGFLAAAFFPVILFAGSALLKKIEPEQAERL